MAYSVEHSSNFHTARRIVKIVAPDFRVFATEDLSPGQSVLDLKKKTIEVPDFQNENQTVALILFQSGHLRLKDVDYAGFKEHFGEILDIGDARLLARLARQGAGADRFAADWAISVLKNAFSIEEPEAEALIEPQVWDESKWREYYS